MQIYIVAESREVNRKKRAHDDDDDKMGMKKKRQVNDVCLLLAIDRKAENQTNRAPNNKIVNIVTHTHDTAHFYNAYCKWETIH